MYNNFYEHCLKIHNTLTNDEKYEFNLVLCEAFKVGATSKDNYLSLDFDYWWKGILTHQGLYYKNINYPLIKKFELRIDIQNTVDNIIDK